MFRILVIAVLMAVDAFGDLAGGRPNTFSAGLNAFAGVVNPANAIWVADRVDVEGFWFYQNPSLKNQNDNPRFLPGKTDLSYGTKNYFTGAAAVHKHFTVECNDEKYDFSCDLAYYTQPNIVRAKTKKAIPASGITPISIFHKIDTLSGIFSLKLNERHSVGFSVDYYYLSHKRNGFQNSDNALRSVSPGHVTNNGMDHSQGVGLTLGWHWKITDKLIFGTAWVKKTYCGQFRKYRGFEPHHGRNYIPQSLGAGFAYLFNEKLRGRLEVLWTNLGNTPNANNGILPNGQLNTHKRGSDKSPGPGLQDATFINMGLGYRWNTMLSTGLGYSHRIRLTPSKNFLSRSYTRDATYHILSFGMNLKYKKLDCFLTLSYGFNNKRSGCLPSTLGGGSLTSQKQTASATITCGYLF